MPEASIRPFRGLTLRSGKQAPNGYMRKTRNSRFLAGDPNARLFALLGRSSFNTAAITEHSAADGETLKTLFPYFVDGGTSKLIAHVGGALYEADLGATGTFAEAYEIDADLATPVGTPAGYKTLLYYPVGASGFFTRSTSGWRRGGHRNMTDTFTTAPQGSGSFESSTEIHYIIRLYSTVTGTESFHSAVVAQALFSGAASIRLTFASGITAPDDIATHARIYRTFLDEPAGVYTRVDPQMTGYVDGLGLPLALFTAGFTVDDDATNTEAQINGQAQFVDGQEGTIAWAEYGGEPPAARGGIIFKDHLVLWGIPGRETEIICSARGYPEAFPVDFDGDYQYFLRMSTTKQDFIQAGALAGNFLCVGTEQSVFRISTIPTYADPGFDRIVQDTLTTETGFAGPEAVCSFGIGDQEAQWMIFVSREHGPMLSNGLSCEPIQLGLGWNDLVAPDAMEDVICRNYPLRQEVWIGYSDTEALILSYAEMSKYGVRCTGPVDVDMDAACYGVGNDKVARFYIADAERLAYVQDSGSTDEQQNTNEDGDIEVVWRTPRSFLSGKSRKARVQRGFLNGGSGVEREFSVEHTYLDGRESYSVLDKVMVGPEETADSYHAGVAGQAHEVELTYAGPTGSSYDENEEPESVPPFLSEVVWEWGSGGRQARTRST